MTRRILFLHGINAPTDPGPMKAEWDAALRTSIPADSDIETMLCHYRSDIDLVEPAQGGLGSSEREIIEAWALALFPETAQGMTERLVHQLSRFLALRLDHVPERVVRRWIERGAWDAHVYLNISNIRTRIQTRFADMVNHYAPHAIFAHSLGSVIAYEVLSSELVQGHSSPVLVTAGSPLATPRAILDRVVPAAGIEAPPVSIVSRWINVLSAGDVVAAAGPLKRHFPTVESDIWIDVAQRDCHQASRYLASEPVAFALAGRL